MARGIVRQCLSACTLCILYTDMGDFVVFFRRFFHQENEKKTSTNGFACVNAFVNA